MDDIKRALLGDPVAAERVSKENILIPCPSCGGCSRFEVLLTRERVTQRGWEFHIACSDCGIHTQKYTVEATISKTGEIEFRTDERKSAITEWNTRPPLLAPEELEALER